MTGLESWRRMWRELGAPAGDEGLHQRLLDAWSEPQRHYHTLQHLNECLSQFAPVRHLGRHPAEVELALWFHDAFYEPRRHDNEERSAAWAVEATASAGVAPEVGRRVSGLVMLTCGHEPPTDVDGQLLVDVDLSILGAERERFDESDEQIRREYAHVPDADFRTGRSKILAAFLARPRLYCTGHFHALLEARARDNLRHSLDKLAAKGGPLPCDG